MSSAPMKEATAAAAAAARCRARSGNLLRGTRVRRRAHDETGKRGPHAIRVLGNRRARGVRAAGSERVREALVIVEHLAYRGRRSDQHAAHELGHVQRVVDLDETWVAEQAQEDPVERV